MDEDEARYGYIRVLGRTWLTAPPTRRSRRPVEGYTARLERTLARIREHAAPEVIEMIDAVLPAEKQRVT